MEEGWEKRSQVAAEDSLVYSAMSPENLATEDPARSQSLSDGIRSDRIDLENLTRELSQRAEAQSRFISSPPPRGDPPTRKRKSGIQVASDDESFALVLSEYFGGRYFQVSRPGTAVHLNQEESCKVGASVTEYGSEASLGIVNGQDQSPRQIHESRKQALEHERRRLDKLSRTERLREVRSF